jgi:hypothetical protein
MDLPIIFRSIKWISFSLLTICRMYLAISHCYPVFHCPVLPLLFITLNANPFFAICYAFLATSHGHAFVLTNNVSRLNEHTYQPVFLPAHNPPVQSNKRTAPGQHVTCLKRADLFAPLFEDYVGLDHSARYSRCQPSRIELSGIPDVSVADCKRK